MGMFDELIYSGVMQDGNQSDGYQTKSLRNKMDQYSLDAGTLLLKMAADEDWEYVSVNKVIPITARLLCWASCERAGKEELFTYRLHFKEGTLTQIDALGANYVRTFEDFLELEGAPFWDFLKEDKEKEK